MEGGATLADAMRKHPKIFDRLYVNMIRAGEAGGVLDVILNRLTDFMEKAEALKRKVKGALIYPVVVIIFAAMCSCSQNPEPEPGAKQDPPKSTDKPADLIASIKKELGDGFTVERVDGIFYVASDAGPRLTKRCIGTVSQMYAFLYKYLREVPA